MFLRVPRGRVGCLFVFLCCFSGLCFFVLCFFVSCVRRLLLWEWSVGRGGVVIRWILRVGVFWIFSFTREGSDGSLFVVFLLGVSGCLRILWWVLLGRGRRWMVVGNWCVGVGW